VGDPVLTFHGMRQTENASELATETAEFTIEGGCVVCHGPMAVRVTPGSTRGYCARCGWISRPIVWQSETGIAVLNPPLARA